MREFQSWVLCGIFFLLEHCLLKAALFRNKGSFCFASLATLKLEIIGLRTYTENKYLLNNGSLI